MAPESMAYWSKAGLALMVAGLGTWIFTHSLHQGVHVKPPPEPYTHCLIRPFPWGDGQNGFVANLAKYSFTLQYIVSPFTTLLAKFSGILRGGHGHGHDEHGHHTDEHAHHKDEPAHHKDEHNGKH